MQLCFDNFLVFISVPSSEIEHETKGPLPVENWVKSKKDSTGFAKSSFSKRYLVLTIIS